MGVGVVNNRFDVRDAARVYAGVKAIKTRTNREGPKARGRSVAGQGWTWGEQVIFRTSWLDFNSRYPAFYGQRVALTRILV